MFFDKKDVLMDFGKIIAPISWSTLPPEFMTSLLAFLISLILILIINTKVRNYDPLRKPSGFMNVCEIVINFADMLVVGKLQFFFCFQYFFFYLWIRRNLHHEKPPKDENLIRIKIDVNKVTLSFK